MADDPPENEEHRVMVREIGAAMHVIVERELGCACEMVLIVRRKGDRRAYFVTNTPEAGEMMRDMLDHLPHAIAEIRAREKERPN